MRTLHVGLRVDDLDASIAFYRHLGYEVVGRVPETDIGSLVMLKLPDDPFVTVELVHRPGDGSVTAGALNHLVVQVEDLPATLAGLERHGITAPALVPRRDRHLPRRSAHRPERSRDRARPVAAWAQGGHDLRRFRGSTPVRRVSFWCASTRAKARASPAGSVTDQSSYAREVVPSRWRSATGTVDITARTTTALNARRRRR